MSAKYLFALPLLAIPFVMGCAHGYVGVGVNDRPRYDHYRDWYRRPVVVVHPDVDRPVIVPQRHDVRIDGRFDRHEASDRW